MASQKILHQLLNDGYFGTDGKIAKLHQHFAQQLQAMAGRHPRLVRGPWGLGAMIALTPLDGQLETVKKLAFALYDAGVIAFIAGANPTRLRFLVPIGAVTTDDIDAVCSILEKTIVEMSDS